jgi:hypothetical protein
MPKKATKKATAKTKTTKKPAAKAVNGAAKNGAEMVKPGLFDPAPRDEEPTPFDGLDDEDPELDAIADDTDGDPGAADALADTSPAPASGPGTLERVLTRSLKCVLTADELAEKAREIDTNFGEMAEVEAELDSLARKVKSAKSRLEALTDDNREIARTRRDGYEYRDVDCEERRDDASLEMHTVRLDTGEILESRALRSDERQGVLFDAEPAVA